MSDSYIYQSIDEVLIHLHSLTTDKKNAVLNIAFKIRDNYLCGREVRDAVGFYAKFLTSICYSLSEELIAPTIYESGEHCLRRVEGIMVDYTSLTSYVLESTLCSFHHVNLGGMTINMSLQLRNNTIINSSLFPAIDTNSILHLLLDTDSELETVYAREPIQVPPSTIVQ